MLRIFCLPRFDLFSRKALGLGLSLVVGSILGMLIAVTPIVASSSYQIFIPVIPIALTAVILFKDLQRLILFTIAIGIPLNFDFSLIVSPYARNSENIAMGHRTIVALTELRISLLLIVVVIGYLLWLVERHDGRRQPVRFFTRTSLPTVGLIFISLLSIAQAEDIQLSFFKIAQLIELFLLYFYLANHIHTRQDLRFFLLILIGGMLAESLLMIVQWRTGLQFYIPGIEVSMYGDRAAGTLGQATVSGGLLAATLLIVISKFWLAVDKPTRFFPLGCFIIGCVALVSTFSRAAWGSFAAAFLCFLFFGWRRGWVKGRSIIVLALIGLVIGAAFYPLILGRLTGEDFGSASSRIKMARLAWNVLNASPSHLAFGVGANNYALIAPAYNTTNVGDLGYVIDSSVHNTYILTTAETGLIGLFIFLGLLYAPISIAWRHGRSDDRFLSLMGLGLGCALVSMYVQMMVDPFVARPLMTFVLVLIALTASLDNLQAGAAGVPARVRG